MAKQFVVTSLADPQKAWKIPTGATSDRPAAPAQGQIRYNTTNGAPEYYDGAAWVDFSAASGSWNHQATQNIDMNEFDIVEANNIYGGTSGVGPSINLGASGVSLRNANNLTTFSNSATRNTSVLAMEFAEIASPPIGNLVGALLYAKSSDNQLYYRDLLGVEHGPLGATGGTGEWTDGGNFIYPSDGGAKRVLIGTTSLDSGNALSVVSTSGSLASFNTSSAFGIEPIISLGRSRGSPASPSAVQSGDILGTLAFSGHNGSAFSRGAGYTASSTETWDATHYGSKLEFFTFRNAALTSEVNFLLDEVGNVRLTSGNTGTTSTGGFLYTASVAGTPTGVPGKTYTGTVPILVDTTGNKLWAYFGGAWSNLSGSGGSSEWTDAGGFLHPADSISERVLLGSTVETNLPTTSTYLNIAADATATANLLVFSSTAADVSKIRSYRARGTQASPAAVQADDDLGEWNVLGWSTAFSAGLKMVAEATETWGAAARGVRFKIQTNKTGTITPVDQFQIRGGGDVVLTDGSAISTSTDGFVWVTRSTGPPTGVVTAANVTAFTGRAPIHIDTTNGRLYAYYASAWNNLSGSGGSGPFTDAGSFIYPTTTTDRLLLGNSVETSLATTNVYLNVTSNSDTIQGISSFGASKVPEVLFSSAEGTQASPTDTPGIRTLGRLGFRGYQSGFSSAASIFAQSTGAWNGSDHGTSITLSTTKSGSTTLTQRLKIDGSGNVLLGESGLAASATDGFSLITRLTAAPSGAVADTAFSPIAYDATNNELYGRGSSAWMRINEWHAGSGFIYQSTAANRLLVGSSVETNLAASALEVVGVTGMYRFSSSNGPFISTYHAGGTQASPTATASLTTLHRLSVNGYESTGPSFSTGGRMTWSSPVGYTNTNYSTDFKIEKVKENTTLENVFHIDLVNNVILATGGVATNATGGFVYLPTTTGTPTGTASAVTGHAAVLVDTGAGKLWAYLGGTWKSVTFA